MRTAARIDGNHQAIVAALRKIGASAQSLAAVGKGCPDLVVGYRGINLLLEVKNPDADRGTPTKLNAAEQEFYETWAGQVAVVTSAEEAVRVVVEAARPR